MPLIKRYECIPKICRDLYIVCNVRRGAFSNLAEFITVEALFLCLLFPFEEKCCLMCSKDRKMEGVPACTMRKYLNFTRGKIIASHTNKRNLRGILKLKYSLGE